MEDRLICTPIGYFFGKQSEKYMAPRQAELGENEGVIILHGGFNFEQAVQDLEGFERIWLIYWLDRNKSWKPKVLTPRGGHKKGVFATRSPHRPNPIGLSCVKLLKIKSDKLFIGKNDLLDGTPILDIKPYLVYADAFPTSRQGWVEEAPKDLYELHWTPLAMDQAKFIEEHQNIPLIDSVALRLKENPFPFKNHRIKLLRENLYELGFQTWRLHYTIDDKLVTICEIVSGYDLETLEGRKLSRWKDVPIHQTFIKRRFTGWAG